MKRLLIATFLLSVFLGAVLPIVCLICYVITPPIRATATIDQWEFPVKGGAVVKGVVSGHPSYKDGEVITTSKIVSVNHKKGTIITENGVLYQLLEYGGR